MIEHVWLEHGIVRWHIGAVSAQQYQFSNAELREDDRFVGVHYLIDDFLDCTALPEIELVAPAGAVRCADWTRPNTEFRQAIVSSSAALRERAYRLALSSLGSPATMKFSDMAKAREWVRGDMPELASTALQWAGAGIAAAPATYARASRR
ncbi:MAG: hypothetical protein RLZZ22_911 [Pseudomonadota bacterium]